MEVAIGRISGKPHGIMEDVNNTFGTWVVESPNTLKQDLEILVEQYTNDVGCQETLLDLIWEEIDELGEYLPRFEYMIKAELVIEEYGEDICNGF